VSGGSGSRFPLHVEAGKRYLIDAQGQPFFVHGDSAWSLMVQLTREEVEQYLENRRLKGFNTILVELIEKAYSANPPYNRYGEAPFTVAGDFSTPNEAYFAHAEYVIARAAAKGMLVMLAPAYLGCCGDGWSSEMSSNGEAKLRAYGQYLASRFRAHDNVLWVHGGDANPPDKTLLRAIANGIRDVETKWLQTFHGSRGTAALEFLGTAESWLTVNDIYTDGTTVIAEAFGEYARSTMPFFLIEAWYEESEQDSGLVRNQAYQAVLSGAMGHLYGNSPVWHFNAPSWSNPSGLTWQQALDSTGARTLSHLRALFDASAWWTLEPDVSNTLLTSGIQSGAARAPAARATDGSFALIYMPNLRTLTVNLARLSGPNVRARWYDPTTGNHAAIAGSPFPAGGSRTFTPSGNNAGGYGDWVLVLDSVP